MMPLPCTVQKVEIWRDQKLKGTCISYIENNDLFLKVHNICI